MPDVYVIKRDLKYHIDYMSIVNIMNVTEIMIEEMDEWLEYYLHITDARGYYEYVLGNCIHSRLQLGNRSLNGIPVQIDYSDSNEYMITLRCKGDNLGMPYRNYEFKQQFNAIWGVPSFSGVEPTKVIFNGPATIVFWSDKTKTIVKRADNELDDKEKALAMCLLKKNEKLFKFCRKEAAKQEDKECETLHNVIDKIFNTLTGGKDGN